MFSSAGPTLSEALRAAAMASGLFSAIAYYIGLVISNSKNKPPLPRQCILGLTLDTRHNKVALKTNKPEKLTQLIIEMETSKHISTQQLQSLEGNVM